MQDLMRMSKIDKAIMALAFIAACMVLAALYSVSIELSQRSQYHQCIDMYPGAVTDLEMQEIDIYCHAITNYKK